MPPSMRTAPFCGSVQLPVMPVYEKPRLFCFLKFLLVVCYRKDLYNSVQLMQQRLANTAWFCLLLTPCFFWTEPPFSNFSWTCYSESSPNSHLRPTDFCFSNAENYRVAHNMNFDLVVPSSYWLSSHTSGSLHSLATERPIWSCWTAFDCMVRCSSGKTASVQIFPGSRIVSESSLSESIGSCHNLFL